MKCILALILGSFLLNGCVTTKFTDTITHPDKTVSVVTYSGMSTAWPFAKLDSGVHSMACQFGTAKINVGQEAKGFDNTNQTQTLLQVLSVLAPLAVAAPK